MIARLAGQIRKVLSSTAHISEPIHRAQQMNLSGVIFKGDFKVSHRLDPLPHSQRGLISHTSLDAFDRSVLHRLAIL